MNENEAKETKETKEIALMKMWGKAIESAYEAYEAYDWAEAEARKIRDATIEQARTTTAQPMMTNDHVWQLIVSDCLSSQKSINCGSALRRKAILEMNRRLRMAEEIKEK